jgi:hypothetical protein
MNKNQIGTALLKLQDKAINWIDLKRELEPFAPQLAEAIEEEKQGKIRKLKKLASNLEVLRVMQMFIKSWENGDFVMMEYYGKIIRESMMDKPKVSLEHSGDGKTFPGVVVLPAVTEGTDHVND